MNHLPFEEWLLNDKSLASAEKNELEAHLRKCPHCTALAETGMALQSVRVVSPAAGFAARFQMRLAEQKVAERRRRLWGLIVLILTVVGFIGWITAPYILALLTSPVEWLSALIGYFLLVFISLLAYGEALSVLARVVPNFIPPYMWMVFVSALAGIGLLWAISIWRFSNVSQGASQ